MKRRRITYDLKKLSAVLIIVGVVLFMYILGMPCPILFTTGISCPGCGMTRAFISLIQLDFCGAFHYHPLIFIIPVFALVLILKSKLPSKVYHGCLIAIICIFLVTYFIRLLDPTDCIVKIDFENGLLYKLFHAFC